MADKKTGFFSKKRKKILLIIFSCVLLCGAFGWFALDRWSKKHGFSGAGEFVKTVVLNYWSSFDAEYETAEITISDADYQKLESQREAHLRRGIITKTEDRYVPAIITFKGKKIKCRIRLKGHMTDHLQEKKWSFRVKTAGGDAFQGMKIFSLMHPGTRNYIYEWIYHQMLEEEEIATVRYSFLNLKLNGESWGIYAVEENFADELISNHRLPKGPIVGFNPDMYWYSRLNEHEGKKVNLDNIRFTGTYPEAYDENELFKSEEQQQNYAEAIAKMHKFITGELSTSEVFDIKKLARFHAILDLVGGQFSLDWSDVKYYYNPQSQLLEPVGYESFSVRNTADLCGASKFRNSHGDLPELHELLFSDIRFFKIYVKELKRISNPSYLNLFFDRHDHALKNNLAILYAEFPYKKLPLNQYYRNQNNIKTLLNEPLTAVGYLEKVKKDTAYFTLGNTSTLPMEVIAVYYDDSLVEDRPGFISSARKKNEVIYYENLKFHFIRPANYDESKFEFVLQHPGMKKEQRIKVKPVGFGTESKDFEDALAKDPNYRAFDFLIADEENKTISFKPGVHVLTEDLVFPEGYAIIGRAPLRIILNNHSSIISRSAFRFNGNDEDGVEITSTDSTGNGIIIMETGSASFFNYTTFSNLGMEKKKKDTHDAGVNLYKANSIFNNCIFSSFSLVGIRAVHAVLAVRNSGFYNFKNAVKVDFSNFSLHNSVFNGISEEALGSNSSFGKMAKVEINFSGTGIHADEGTTLTGNDITFQNVKVGVNAVDFSLVILKKVVMDQVAIGFIAEKKSDVFGPASIKVTGLTRNSVTSLVETDKKSKVEIK